MKYIIDFYQELDTINLILFWGVIIVIILLLIFSIALANKNRKLKELLLEKEQDNPDDIPVITENHYHENNYISINKDITETTNKTVVTENNNSEVKNINEEHLTKVEQPSEKIIHEDKHIEQPIPSKTFIAEEHIMKYHKEEPVKATTSTPYQKNVLREMSLNQTSPIGIVKKTSEEEKVLNNVKDLDSSLKQDVEPTRKPHSNYLDELSAKLKEADIERTDYELHQEEDAIISYQELIAKKNELEMDEEEDAVISLDELIARNKEREKLYNITEEEENDEFINELKHFRRDL